MSFLSRERESVLIDFFVFVRFLSDREESFCEIQIHDFFVAYAQRKHVHQEGTAMQLRCYSYFLAGVFWI